MKNNKVVIGIVLIVFLLVCCCILAAIGNANKDTRPTSTSEATPTSTSAPELTPTEPALVPTETKTTLLSCEYSRPDGAYDGELYNGFCVADPGIVRDRVALEFEARRVCTEQAASVSCSLRVWPDEKYFPENSASDSTDEQLDAQVASLFIGYFNNTDCFGYYEDAQLKYSSVGC